jgi:hypothetical protein
VPGRSQRDAWWDRWPSTPIPVQGGIAVTRQRGEIVEAWWSRRFVDVLESFGLGGRMERGRRYARAGQVRTLELEPGRIHAEVQGTRPRPYDVEIAWPLPDEAAGAALEEAFRSRIRFAASLLAGELPPELEGEAERIGFPLLPARWRDLRTSCTCPDPERPCKHVAAALYVFADRLEDDPWLLLEWRGRPREQLLAHLGLEREVDPRLPPWWPLAPGRGRSSLVPPPIPPADPPERPDHVLDRLGWPPVQLTVASFDVRLRALYAAVLPTPDEESEAEAGLAPDRSRFDD